jgi:uncharacterized membrane protein HdeD (DUF308 family)
MKLNESNMDRIVRVVAGIALLGFGFFGSVSTTLGIVLSIVGVILILTGAIGFCPIYFALKLSTKK